jgi:2-dehydropantoate 2-reductase
MRAALQAAGFKVEIVPDARALIWAKLVINAAINPLTALLRIRNGELLERPAARALMGRLAEEAAAVAAAEQVALPFSDAASAAEQVARRTSGNHSSMLQDVLRAAPTEIDSICGAITRAGERHGLPTPVNRLCWELLQAAVPQAHSSA